MGLCVDVGPLISVGESFGRGFPLLLGESEAEQATVWLQMLESEVAGLKCRVGPSREAQKREEGPTGPRSKASAVTP